MAENQNIVSARVVKRNVVQTTQIDLGSIPGYVLIEPELLGICGTDIAMLQGLRPTCPDVLGHEVVGHVRAVHPDHQDVRVGDRVTLNPTRPDSPETQVGEFTDGAFGTLFALDGSFVEGAQIIAVPDDIPSAAALLGEPLACVAHTQAAMGELAGTDIGIIGAGIYAQMHARLALLRGARRVTMYNRSARRLDDLARRNTCAGVELKRMDQMSPSSHDRVIIALSSGGPEAFERACSLVESNGLINVWGGFDPVSSVVTDDHGERLDLYRIKLMNQTDDIADPKACVFGGKRLFVTGSRGARQSDFDTAFEVLRTMEHLIDAIVTHVTSFEALPEALHHQVSGIPDAFGNPLIKVIVDMHSSAGIETFRAWRQSHGIT